MPAWMKTLFTIWSLFYQASAGWNVCPPSEQQRLHLKDISALLLLDDIRLSENEIRAINAFLPRSTIIFSTEQQTVYSIGYSLPLSGLPLEHMRRLAEIQLIRLLYQGPDITDDVLAHYWRKHKGNPFLMVQGNIRLGARRGIGNSPCREK